jgi:hypothetical protein
MFDINVPAIAQLLPAIVQANPEIIRKSTAQHFN